MVMKKIITAFLLSNLLLNGAFAADVMPNVKTEMIELTKKEYKHKTVLKHYTPYTLKLKNTNGKPILLSANTEVDIVTLDGKVIKSDSRRTQYRKSRKRDMGRYYGLALPGAINAGGVTGITLFIGAPIGAAIYVGMAAPTDKAVRGNVKISQDLYAKYDMPVRIEPNTDYEVRLLLPNDVRVKELKITNTSFDLKKMYDLTIPVEEL